MGMKAKFWDKEKGQCLLCPHACYIQPGRTGVCSGRTNIDGQLVISNYGEITSIGLDPIEKKPLYHFHPGRQILSVGTFGCNFSCDFCQNYRIAQQRPPSRYMSPEDLVVASIEAKIQDNIGLAFTYNEPTIWYEYVYDTAKLLKERAPEQKIVLISNGFINSEPLEELLPYVDAMNIDLKAWDDNYYRKICGGRLEPVLRTIERASRSCHVELTTLLVTGENDSPEQVEGIASFLAGIDPGLVLHLSRYFPNYQRNSTATDVETMYQLEEVARKHLQNVYLGNIR